MLADFDKASEGVALAALKVTANGTDEFPLLL
jgi:hypothetical protein